MQLSILLCIVLIAVSDALHLTTCMHAPTCPKTVIVEGLPVLQEALQLTVERRLPQVKSLPWPMINETHLFPQLVMDWTCCNASRPSDLVFWAYNHTTRHLVVSRDVASETYPDLAEYIMHLGRLHMTALDAAVHPPMAQFKKQASDPIVSPVLLTLAIVGTLLVVAFLGFLLFF